MARSFISSEQEEMRRIIGFLASQGAAGINRFNTSKDVLLREVYSGKYKPREPIFVFYTYDMIGKFSALSRLAPGTLILSKTALRATNVCSVRS